MKRMKTSLLNKISYKPVLIVFLCVCVVTSIFCFQYYNQLQGAIREESRGYLQEISERIGSSINRIIGDNYASLYTIASVLQNFETDSFEEIQPVVHTQKEYWKYQDIMFIDESGAGYSSTGDSIPLNNDDYFTDTVIHSKPGISTTQMIDNQECIMLAVPLENMKIGGKTMVALAASYLPDVFEQTLSMSSFNEQAYSCVINKTGTLVVRSNSSSSLKLGYNALTTVGESNLDAADSIDQVKQDINQDVAGQIGFTQHGIRYYMVYTPVNPDSWYLLTFVPSSAVNEKSDMILTMTLFLCGIITLVFAALIGFLMVISYRNKQKLEQIAYVDDITQGYTIQKFYEQAQAALEETNRPPYVLVYTNMQKFKVLNEQFGRDACDGILRTFHDTIHGSLSGNECMGRLSADNFCILMRYEGEEGLLARFQGWYERANEYIVEKRPAWSLPITEFGVYLINDSELPFPQIIDRAKLALREFSRVVNSKLRYAIYNDEAHHKLFREKQLEDMMEAALKQGEFQVYLQPKYYIPEHRIGGAEALARWANPSEGMIFPNEFIPLFEKNGFVVQLDLWVFEQICKHLRIWLDKGLDPVKISVNCSRVQLNFPDFLKGYRDIAQKYQVPPRYIEIELTESVVMEDVQRLAKVINDIHAIGFGCSMDDFGSGYSSLNLIQSIPVDTLKLDKIFFDDSSHDPKRTESVVGSIVGMAKALSMDTVAEGVEHHDQVEMLRRIGCDYIQGYVFAKPMPIAQFEELLFGVENK